MQKISKTQLVTRDTLCRALEESYAALEKAVDAFNTARTELWDAVAVAQDAYNQVVADANEWLEDIASQLEDFVQKHSEKWQEGDRGKAYSAWYETFNNALEASELTEPDGLELETSDQVETLADCPEEVELT